MLNASVWPTKDYSRVPYSFYHDAGVYQLERERLFSGPTWSLVGLEAEIPNPGDFRASYIGETPIVFHRDDSGDIHAFVNRCAHRGSNRSSRAARERQGPYLHLPSVVLLPGRIPRRRSVSSWHQGKRGLRQGFLARRPRPSRR